MKKLTKAQIAEMHEAQDAYRDAADDLTKAIEEYNAALYELNQPLEAAIEKYKDALSNVRQFRDEVVQEMTDYEGDRSEKWHESDAGQSYGSWKETWESVELEEPEFEVPQPLPEFDYVENPFEDSQVSLADHTG